MRSPPPCARSSRPSADSLGGAATRPAPPPRTRCRAAARCASRAPRPADLRAAVRRSACRSRRRSAPGPRGAAPRRRDRRVPVRMDGTARHRGHLPRADSLAPTVELDLQLAVEDVEQLRGDMGVRRRPRAGAHQHLHGGHRAAGLCAGGEQGDVFTKHVERLSSLHRIVPFIEEQGGRQRTPAPSRCETAIPPRFTIHGCECGAAAPARVRRPRHHDFQSRDARRQACSRSPWTAGWPPARCSSRSWERSCLLGISSAAPMASSPPAAAARKATR